MGQIAQHRGASTRGAHPARRESLYSGLLEAAPDAMVVVDGRGEIVLLNVQAEKQFGYRRDELVGQPVTAIIPDGFAERIIADDLRSAADALAQQIGTGLELVALRRDGTEFPIEIMLSPLESDEGILVTAAIRDISARKAAAEELRATRERLQGFVDANLLGIFIARLDGTVIEANDYVLDLVGHTRAEFDRGELDWLAMTAPESRISSDAAVREMRERGRAAYEREYLRADGTRVPVLVADTLLSGPDQLVAAFVLDISARKAVETKLARSEARYAGLLEAAPDAMVVVDGRGEIVLLNVQAEKQFGYRRDELVGQPVTAIIPDGFAERIIADDLRSAADALAQQIGTGLELVALRRDGTEFPIEIMLSPLESDEGILVTAAIRDISARKAAAEALLRKMEELARSNEELGQFAYVASHDLQEPLRMVTSYMQLLSRRYAGRLDSDADEFIAFAVDGASRMRRLIGDLLAYSRVGSKGAELIDTSSEDALRQALVNLGTLIEETDAVVTHDPLPSVRADEPQLVQLFQNLVGNAITYHGTEVPRIHISAAIDAEDRWSFAVTDNGIGIDSQYFERIFGMFQRLHDREEYAGTGIGLAICRKIVERHGGTISVESQPGRGSTFRFTLVASQANL